MADCFAPDVDDLHRRWLPREIFADIGIVDTAPPSAAAVAVEDVAAHLTGILGGKEVTPRPPPPPVPAPHHRSHHQPAQVSTRLLGTRKAAANLQVSVVNAWFLIVSAPYVARVCLQVCGQQGAVLVAYGGGCGGVGAPVAPWPFLAPYPPLQWQVSGRTRPLRPPSFSSQIFLSLFSPAEFAISAFS
jgi:hypothetical protein